MSDLIYLQEFYKDYCNKENFFGVEITTKGAQGWCISIDLFDTIYENKNFDIISMKIDNNNWIKCFKDNHVFRANCGIDNLAETLRIFLKWITNK